MVQSELTLIFRPTLTAHTQHEFGLATGAFCHNGIYLTEWKKKSPDKVFGIRDYLHQFKVNNINDERSSSGASYHTRKVCRNWTRNEKEKNRQSIPNCDTVSYNKIICRQELLVPGWSTFCLGVAGNNTSREDVVMLTCSHDGLNVSMRGSASARLRSDEINFPRDIYGAASLSCCLESLNYENMKKDLGMMRLKPLLVSIFLKISQESGRLQEASRALIDVKPIQIVPLVGNSSLFWECCAGIFRCLRMLHSPEPSDLPASSCFRSPARGSSLTSVPKTWQLDTSSIK